MTITPPATVKWLLLEACTDSLAQSHDIDLPIDYTGQQVMEEFRKISKYDNIPRHIGLKLPTLSIATVSPVSTMILSSSNNLSNLDRSSPIMILKLSAQARRSSNNRELSLSSQKAFETRFLSHIW